MSKTCTRCGGDGPFYRHRAVCKSCQKAYIAQWQKDHPEARCTSKLRYQQNHPDRVRETNSRYARSHPDYLKGWRLRNFAKWLSYCKRRYEWKADGTLTKEQWQDTLYVFNHVCAYCLRGNVKLTMDHMIPISKGGPHAVENVVPACRPCNSRKGPRSIFWMLRTS
jgi:5-methylcytosine-specific restriction endonuclease McrA